jgi:hypothetical protein
VIARAVVRASGPNPAAHAVVLTLSP